MRTILTALFMTLATQSNAQNAVYEFSAKTLKLFLVCDGDTSNEKMNVELTRNSKRRHFKKTLLVINNSVYV